MRHRPDKFHDVTDPTGVDRHEQLALPKTLFFSLVEGGPLGGDTCDMTWYLGLGKL